MIQRKQTVFYLLAILAAVIPLFGMDIITLSNEAVTHHITFFGTTTETIADGAVIKLNPPSFPLYFGNLILVALLFFTIILYKALRLQLRLGRFVLSFYLLLLVLLGIFIYYLGQLMMVAGVVTAFGTGTYIFAAGIIFVWLGNRGVLKDKRLIDSVDRIR